MDGTDEKILDLLNADQYYPPVKRELLHRISTLLLQEA